MECPSRPVKPVAVGLAAPKHARGKGLVRRARRGAWRTPGSAAADRWARHRTGCGHRRCRWWCCRHRGGLRCRRYEKKTDSRVRAAAVAGDRDIVRVSAEPGDVLPYPLQGGDDVLQAEVRSFLECTAVLGEGKPPKWAEPAVRGHTDRPSGRCETGGIGCRQRRGGIPS